MKKAYSKPEIMFEDFTLNVSIAGSCEAKTDAPTSGSCGLNFGSGFVFLDTISACTIPVTSEGGDGEYNGICYHVPTNGTNVFAS